MLFVSQIIELLYLSRLVIIVNLQPSLFALASVHLIFDDSRARLPPEKGGLGYHGPFTTLQGVCRTVEEHLKVGGIREEKSHAGDVSLGFLRLSRALKEMNKIEKRISERLRVEAVD
ncbi:hypothetical protein BDR07DRAFT_1390458 [Suillus spraguei]|nr:hypothetical protein BDR07DRAFT_1390458 [Suillus spraguei]